MKRMNKPKEKLNIPELPTVDLILSELDFLPYSTHKRNLAYQLQFLDFLNKLAKSYDIYGGIKKCLIRQQIVVATNIIEYLLFISLRQIYANNPKSNGLPDLIGQAKRKSLISKPMAKSLNDINNLRNKIHPSKQIVDLDLKFFTDENIDQCNSVVHSLISDLREFFIPQDIQVETLTKKCAYENYHLMYFLDSERCPYCGEYGY